MRKGLFLSRNRGSISGTVDLEKLAADHKGLALVKIYDQFFGPEEQHDIITQVKQYQLEAVVFAGNSPSYFDPGRQGEALMAALNNCGINPNKISVANIDEQVAKPHRGKGAHATRKAGLLIDAALAKVEHCHAIDTVPVRPRRDVLVIGTTVGAVVASYYLLEKDYGVHIIERNPAWRSEIIHNEKFHRILRKVKAHGNLDVLLDSNLESSSGWCGEFTVECSTPLGPRKKTVGGIIICAGDDTGWIADLRPTLRMDTDDHGFLIGRRGMGFDGLSINQGILFLPFRGNKAPPKSEAADANKAVGLLTGVLDRPTIDHPLLVSEVEENLCGGCGTCVKTCAFSASSVDIREKISIIDPKRCVGCGNCVTSCPTGARDLIAYPTQYITQAIHILSQGAAGDDEPKILAFLCKSSGYPAADTAANPAITAYRHHYSPNVMPLRIECAGNVDTRYMLEAFRNGFGGVALVVCKDGHCRNVVGNTDMERRLGLLRAVLRSRNIDDNRMRIIHIARNEGEKLNTELKALSAEIKSMNRR